MTPFGSSRRLAGALAVLLAAALQVGCGGSGGGPEIVTEAVRSKARALSATATADTQAPELPGYLSPQVVGLTKVAERRVSRTVFDYDFVVQLKNGSRALSNLQAVVTGSGAGTTILTAIAQVGEVPADATVTSTGKVTIRHDRSQPFSTAALAWAFKGVVTASRDPIVVRRADPAMIRTLSSGQKVVMSQLIAVTDGTQSSEQDIAMFLRMGAEVIGRVPEGRLYQLSMPTANDEPSLMAALNTLQANTRVLSVSINEFSTHKATSIGRSLFPSDSFGAEQVGVLTESNVTIAWKTIQENFDYPGNSANSKIKLKPTIVGIIDSELSNPPGCEIVFREFWGPQGEREIGSVVTSEASDSSHGLHVAGIIGAIGDNRSSCSENRSQVAGIAWQSSPRLHVGESDGSLAVEFGHIARLARSGARVINISMGPNGRADRTRETRAYAYYLKNLYRYYDFLLTIAAGNDFDEATKRTYLASVFEEQDQWSGFDDVRSRVLIVANADTRSAAFLSAKHNDSWKDGKSLTCENCGPTNYGVGVGISAPGTEILSLSTEENPTEARAGLPRVKSGTSMAAPMVAGVAAAAWSINDKLSAGQVRSLIVNTATRLLSFNQNEVPKSYSTKGLDKSQNQHYIVDMDAVIRAAPDQPLETPLVSSVDADVVLVELSCYYDEGNHETTTTPQWTGLYLNTRLRLADEAEVRWLWNAWAPPAFPVLLKPGRYLLQLQSGALESAWSSESPSFPVYFELVGPAKGKVHRLKIDFRGASKAACDSENYADMPHPLVSISSDGSLLVPTARAVDVRPVNLSTDAISSWRLLDVAWWVKRITWKFGSGIADAIISIQNGVFEAAKIFIDLPGVREVVAILSDGSQANGVTLAVPPMGVAEGAKVDAFEAVGAVVAGRPAEFLLKGSRLPTGLFVTIDECGVASETVEGSTETQRKFTCTFPASATEGPKEVGVGPVGASENFFATGLASGLQINLVKSSVSSVSAVPAAVVGGTSVVSVGGAYLPLTARVLVIDADCDRSSVSARPDGSGFTQTCTFGPTAGTKGVTVMSSADASGFIIDDSKSLTVSAQQQPATSLFDEFSGTAIDATVWTVDGWDATGNDYTGGLGRGIGPVTIGNGLVEFGRLGRISTKNKVTFSGTGGIVIEGRMAGPGPLHDTTVMLVDSTSGDQILMGDTNYAGFGFYALGVGSYKLKEPSAIADPSNPLALGSTTTAFMEYRLTIIGDKIKIERGPTLANITQTGTGTLGRSIAGRQFHISIGATWAYYPGTWDWIRVKADSAASTGTGKIPHSGVAGSQCYAAGSNALVACDAPGALALNSQQDGHRAGVDAMSYSPVGAYSKEECVKDNVTGLIWEGKTSSGPRAGTRRFANQGTVGTNDADGYVQEVNNARLCGFSDWRLPTVIELQGLVNYGVPSPGPTISTSWFPNTTGAVYWTADGSAERSTEAWYVNFDYGSASWSPRVLLYAVRLVRGDAQPPRYTFNSTGDEVTDTRTGLVWRRCVEGTTWNGSTCTGASRFFTHEGALAHAQSQAGWRLPSVKELSSIADRSRMTPALNTAVFPAVSAGYFWTTTPLVGGPSDAWHVRAETGAVFNTGARSTGNLQVRLVKKPLIAGNGRRYEVIECGTWTQCRSAARAKGGELATVRSQSENDWLVANVLPAAKTEYGLWIGLNDEAQPGVFKWTSGEPVTFTNWRVGEPNNLWIDGRAETYVHMWRGNSNPTFLPGVWNDIIDQPIVPVGGSTSIITQAIVEYAQ